MLSKADAIATGSPARFKSKYVVPMLNQEMVPLLWAVEKYRDHTNGTSHATGLPAHNIPSPINWPGVKGWADDCRVCGNKLELGEKCGCEKPQQFVFMLSSELAVLLDESNYSPAYVRAIYQKFVCNETVEEAAASWGVNPASLKQFCHRVRHKLDALLTD